LEWDFTESAGHGSAHTTILFGWSDIGKLFFNELSSRKCLWSGRAGRSETPLFSITKSNGKVTVTNVINGKLLP
jgi:hypothetical protein